MGKKVERRCGRLELADYLADLSQQLRRGKLEAEGRVWTVPEQVDVKIHLKEEEGCFTSKISWQWSARGESHQGSSEAAPREATSFKAVKVRLGASFKDLQRVIGEGLFPDAKTMADFLQNSRTFAALAKPEWQKSMAEYLTHLDNLQGAVENRLAETMHQELQNLTNCMAACHREFK
jgi:XXXCH domain-containing protein